MQQYIAEADFIPLMGVALALIQNAGGEIVITEIEERDSRSVEEEDGVTPDHEGRVLVSSGKLKDSTVATDVPYSPSHVHYLDCSSSRGWRSNCVVNLCTVKCDDKNKVVKRNLW